MPAHPFLSLWDTTRLRFPACLAARQPRDWAVSSGMEARVTMGVPSPGHLKTLRVKPSVSLPPLSAGWRQRTPQWAPVGEGGAPKWTPGSLYTKESYGTDIRKKWIILYSAKSQRCRSYLLQQLNYPDALPRWDLQGNSGNRALHKWKQTWLQISDNLGVFYRNTQIAAMKNNRWARRLPWTGLVTSQL